MHFDCGATVCHRPSLDHSARLVRFLARDRAKRGSVVFDEDEKTKLQNRLRRVAGQVAAVERMIDEGAYCIDTLTQIAAATGALGKVGQLILESHIRSCVADAASSPNKADRDEKLEELIRIFRKYASLSD